jgi:hypothetical protein
MTLNALAGLIALVACSPEPEPESEGIDTDTLAALVDQIEGSGLAMSSSSGDFASDGSDSDDLDVRADRVRLYADVRSFLNDADYPLEYAMVLDCPEGHFEFTGDLEAKPTVGECLTTDGPECGCRLILDGADDDCGTRRAKKSVSTESTSVKFWYGVGCQIGMNNCSGYLE